MTTQRTDVEARAYIEEAVRQWNIDGDFQKIISLAQFVERWSSKGGGPKAKQKSISKDIKAYALMIKRAKDRDEETDALEGMQSDLKMKLDKLVVEIEGTKRNINTGKIIGKTK